LCKKVNNFRYVYSRVTKGRGWGSKRGGVPKGGFLNFKLNKLTAICFADSYERNDKMSNGKLTEISENDFTNKTRDDNYIETEVITKSMNRTKVTALRSNTDPLVAQARQRRVVKMLFVVVLEFFICWTPIYAINTIALYWPKLIYKGLGYNGISFFHLLAFFSSCTNPITYCFMNSKFRESFLLLFRCQNSNGSDFTSTAFKSHQRSRADNQEFL
jgi:hypothetical protein